MNIIDEIMENLIDSEKKGNKTVEFHYQVLINADKLKDIDVEELCRKLCLTDGYKVEFHKMIKLASYMKSKGKSIV